MSNYCIVDIDKINNFHTLNAKYRHNYRTYQPANADASLSKYNEEIVKLNGKTYEVAVKDKIKDLLKAGTIKTVRKDAIVAIEVVTTFSRDALQGVDIEQWKEDNRRWLNETFNQSDNTDNVISMMYHADEPGEVHIHSIVVPITKDGRLCAKEFTNGPKTMRALQTSYAEAMKKHGLERGLERSVAKNESLKRFYSAVNKCIETSELEPSEKELEDGYLPLEYADRAKNIIETNNLTHLAEKKALERELAESQTTCINQSAQIFRLKEEYDKEKKKMLKKHEQERKTLEKQIKEKDDKINAAISQIANDSNNANLSFDEFAKQTKTLFTFMRGLQHYPDRERAKEIAKGYDEIVHYQRKIEKTHRAEIEKNFAH